MSKPIKRYTVIVPTDGNRVLLGRKLRGMDAGKYNAFGGKVEEGEEVKDGAKREFLEETGCEASQLEKLGVITFEIEGKEHLLEVHFYRLPGFSGEATANEEIVPEWFGSDSIPYDEMWTADRIWLPLLLAGKQFHGSCAYKSDKQTIVSHSISEVFIRVRR